MKKLFILLALVVASVSAASAQGWGIGGRIGNGLQVVGQRYYSSDNYLEARLGINSWRGAGVDLSLLYNWNCFNWDWTPGNWSLDFGVGANVNINSNVLFAGIQGVARFGYTFQNTPLTLAVDYSPAVGPNIGLKKGIKTDFGWTSDNVGLAVIYRF